MSSNPVVDRYDLPEVYHLGYNGTHFEIALNPTYWDKFISFAGGGTPYAQKLGPEYSPPSIFGGKFGFNACATVINTPEGFSLIQVPALSEPGEQNHALSLLHAGMTLSSILFVLNHLVLVASEAKEKAAHDEISQLFTVRTQVGGDQGIHPLKISLSASVLSIEYLTRVGSQFSFLDAMAEMEDHYTAQALREGNVVRLLPRAVECYFYNFGHFYMSTVGDGVVLELDKDDFESNNLSFSSYNVGTISQQFNLLVGIAHVWQMVREGLRHGEIPVVS